MMNRIAHTIATRRRPRVARFLQAVGRSFGATSGSITVELALLLTVLPLLALGAYDLGRYGVEQTAMVSAARAGAQAAMLSGALADPTPVVEAVRQDAGDLTGTLNITVRQFCQCPSAGETSCSAACTDSAYAPMYVEVSVSDNFDLLFHYPGLPQSLALGATSTMRIR
ncbi:MAG: pilus assembly protein [Proteobacteria bacterium]|nr:pilus assembly protein [Pseudomonadota bacterium]